MEKINIAELLKDCPKGMKLDCTIYEDVVFHDIVDRHYPIRVRRKQGGLINLSAYGCMDDKIDSKCIIFPKGKTSWEGFVPPCQFKDGDIVTSKDRGLLVACIYKERKDNVSFNQHIALYKGSLGVLMHEKIALTDDKLRFATEEEKAKLFKAIKYKGYKWNEETKTLEKLPEFKDGDILSYQCTGLRNRTIYIYRHHSTMNTSYYVALDGDDLELMVSRKKGCALSGYNTTARFATEEEKQKLFEAIKAKGYRWNAKTKTLEGLIEPKFKVGDRIKWIKTGNIYEIIKIFSNCYIANYLGSDITILFNRQDEYELVSDKFDITTLKPFDKVLVRMDDKHVWSIQFFERLNTILKDSFVCMGGGRYHQCIPYEGNEHLLNKVVDCNEFYKTWK